MKRVIILILAAAFCVSLSGCQSKENTPVTAQERTTATPTPAPTSTPDPFEAELNEAMGLFDAIDLSVYRIDSDGNLRLIETEWYENPTPEVEASNESSNVFVEHMISKGYEFLRRFQPRFLEKHASNEAARLKYSQASYAIQTGNYYRREQSGENPFLSFDEFYGASDALAAGNCDELLGKLTSCDKKTDEAVFAFLYDRWSDLTEDGISYMIENGLTGIIANSLKVMQTQDSMPSGPNLGNSPEKVIKALVAFEKADTPECREVLSAFESGMKAGAYQDGVIENYTRSVQIENLDNAPKIKAKLQGGGTLLDEIKASPRVLAAFMSCPTNFDTQTISVASADLPDDFMATNPQKGRYFLLVDPAPDRSDSFSPSRFDDLGLTCKSGEELRSVNNPNNAQILVYVKFSYKFRGTYYASNGSSLEVYRGKISLAAKDAVTGKKLASGDISATIKSTYTANPGSLYVSTFPDSAIEKFAKKLVTAANK